jgi:hypothetical protein
MKTKGGNNNSLNNQRQEAQIKEHKKETPSGWDSNGKTKSKKNRRANLL